MKPVGGKFLMQGLLWLVYPLAIFFGLRIMEPRYVAILLASALLLRRFRDAGRLLAGLTRIDLAVVLGLLMLAAVTALTNSETLLRFYPAAMSLGMLLLFGLSLIYPPSMVERFARIAEPDLPPQGVQYTRRVTQVWCVFFVANGTTAALTAVYASRETWALYNGLIAYLLMGALFAGEWIVRRFFIARTSL
ncbi:MAG: hypothetical protein WCL27_12395 [Betaproteobacteria bacterium]